MRSTKTSYRENVIPFLRSLIIEHISRPPMSKKDPHQDSIRTDEDEPYPRETVPPSEIREAAMSSSYGDPVGSPSNFIPRTPLGRELLEIRRRVVATGEPLLSIDQVADEIERRRGRQLDD